MFQYFILFGKNFNNQRIQSNLSFNLAKLQSLRFNSYSQDEMGHETEQDSFYSF